MKKITHICIHLCILTLLIVPLYAHGAAGDSNGSSNTDILIKITNPFNGGDNILDFITAILNNVIMPIAAVGAVMYIIWAGFQYVLAQGNSTKIQSATKNLQWVLIGVGVLLGAAAISKVVQNTVNLFLN